jgi:helicase MOV-10
LGSVEIENDDEDLLPEVVQGNFLWLDDTQDDKRYEARVMHADVFMRRHLAVLKMSLRLPTDFNLYQGAQFVLRLKHDRIALRRQYHALTTALTPRRLLFPSVSDIKPIRHLSKAEVNDFKLHQLVNRKIRDDDQQLQTVVSILEQPPGSVPFIIYGPSVHPEELLDRRWY